MNFKNPSAKKEIQKASRIETLHRIVESSKNIKLKVKLEKKDDLYDEVSFGVPSSDAEIKEAEKIDKIARNVELNVNKGCKDKKKLGTTTNKLATLTDQKEKASCTDANSNNNGSSNGSSKPLIKEVTCSSCDIKVPCARLRDHMKSTLHLFNSTGEPVLNKVWIPETNKGYQILKKYGWREGEGLGVESGGRLEPVSTHFKVDRKGLGASRDKARVTHFPAHIESQALNSIDGLSVAQRAQIQLDTRSRKRTTKSSLIETKKVKKKKEAKVKKKVKKIKQELYSTIPDEYVGYFE